MSNNDLSSPPKFSNKKTIFGSSLVFGFVLIGLFFFVILPQLNQGKENSSPATAVIATETRPLAAVPQSQPQSTNKLQEATVVSASPTLSSAESQAANSQTEENSAIQPTPDLNAVPDETVANTNESAPILPTPYPTAEKSIDYEVQEPETAFDEQGNVATVIIEAPEGSTYLPLALTNLSNPVGQGNNVAISVNAIEEATCSASIFDPQGQLVTNLDPQITDENGQVYWVWQTDPAIPTGDYQLVIRAEKGIKNNTLRATIFVVKPEQLPVDNTSGEILQ